MKKIISLFAIVICCTFFTSCAGGDPRINEIIDQLKEDVSWAKNYEVNDDNFVQFLQEAKARKQQIMDAGEGLGADVNPTKRQEAKLEELLEEFDAVLEKKLNAVE